MIAVASDKFKGTLTALEACQAIADGLRRAGISEEIRLWPMADGGEGTAEILRATATDDADFRVMAASESVGMGCFDLETKRLIDRSSYAFGEAIVRELNELDDRGTLLIGIGGTAVSDGGAGLLQALGYRFYGADRRLISEPITPRLLKDVRRINPPKDNYLIQRLKERGLLLCDVRASLLPESRTPLSALDFARQKGGDAHQIGIITEALNRLRSIFDVRPTLVDGAGGGIGYALGAVIGCRAMPGGDIILERYLKINPSPRLIVTGEGQVDSQSYGGKVVDAVNRYGRFNSVEVVTVGGRVVGRPPYPKVVAASKEDEPLPTTKEEARHRIVEAVATYFSDRASE